MHNQISILHFVYCTILTLNSKLRPRMILGLQKGGAPVLLVGNFCHQTLSSKSVFFWIYGAFKTSWNTEKNKIVSWRQWSSGWSSRKRPEFPTWNSELDDRSKRIFPVAHPCPHTYRWWRALYLHISCRAERKWEHLRVRVCVHTRAYSYSAQLGFSGKITWGPGSWPSGEDRQHTSLGIRKSERKAGGRCEILTYLNAQWNCERERELHTHTYIKAVGHHSTQMCYKPCWHLATTESHWSYHWEMMTNIIQWHCVYSN